MPLPPTSDWLQKDKKALQCDNPLCDRISGRADYCCRACRWAHEGKYEIHSTGILAHTDECNEREVDDES